MQKIHFGDQHKADLRRLGVTDAQLNRLEHALPLIRTDIEGRAANDEIRDAVQQVHTALVKAEGAVQKMLRRATKPWAEAYGPLSSGAASVDPLAEVADIESATDGAVPEFVDVPTLLRLLVKAAEHGIAEVPTKQYRKTAPSKSVAYILNALNRPEDVDSRRSADKLQSELNGKAFMELCSTVLRISTGDRRDVPIDRAIRAFKDAYRFDSGRRYWRQL